MASSENPHGQSGGRESSPAIACKESPGKAPRGGEALTIRGFSTFDIKGISVAAVDLQRASEYICRLATEAHGAHVTVTGAHGIVESTCDERVRTAHQQALMVVPDGMPLVWLGRSLGFKSIGRVRGADLMKCIFANEQYKQLRHFFYGASPSVVSKLLEALRAKFGDVNLVGVYCPPMKPMGYVERNDVLTFIRDLKPDLIWVKSQLPNKKSGCTCTCPESAPALQSGSVPRLIWFPAGLSKLRDGCNWWDLNGYFVWS